MAVGTVPGSRARSTSIDPASGPDPTRPQSPVAGNFSAPDQSESVALQAPRGEGIHGSGRPVSAAFWRSDRVSALRLGGVTDRFDPALFHAN